MVKEKTLKRKKGKKNNEKGRKIHENRRKPRNRSKTQK